MFTHKIDPLVVAELDALKARITEQDSQIVMLKADLAAVEQKLDETLKALDAPENRSIPAKEGEAEPLAVMPGHIPWSQRKKQREMKSRSTEFVEKVRKGAAISEPPTASEG